MAAFSKESLTVAAKILDPVVSHDTRSREPVTVTHRSTIVQEPRPKVNHRASITATSSSADQPKFQEKSKSFDRILSWKNLPAASKTMAFMPRDHKVQTSQKALEFFRAIDIDGNSKLSSVEFFEGMTTKLGLSRDQVLHIMNIHKPKQPGFYLFEEFEDIYTAVHASDDDASQQPTVEQPIDGDDDICVIFDSPSFDQSHPNPIPLTRRNAGVTILWWRVITFVCHPILSINLVIFSSITVHIIEHTWYSRCSFIRNRASCRSTSR